MKKFTFLLVGFVLFSSHDMFLKMDTHFLQPNTLSAIQLFNGTFEKSENIIDRIRMKDVSLVGNGMRSSVDSSQWSEVEYITLLNFKTGEAGTWVAGVSTKPNNIELSAKDFNEYLEHDGVLDMLDWRKENNTLDKSAVEKYSKHVKTIFQVGDKKTDDWKTVLGYPIEFVPVRNPYELKKGDTLQIKLLSNGKPLPNQLVYVGAGTEDHGHSHEEGHTHDHEAEAHHHHDATRLRTDADGLISIQITSEGYWYLRTIQMEHSEEPELTHESNWATLTFQVGQGHLHDDDNHHHPHDHSHGIPSFVYWMIGILLIAGLYLGIRKKR